MHNGFFETPTVHADANSLQAYLPHYRKKNTMSAYAIGWIENIEMGPPIFQYLEKIDDTLTPYWGRFLIHGQPVELLEGILNADLIVIEFPDIERARQWYASPAYQAILPLRSENMRGSIFLVAGLPKDHRASDILSLNGLT